MSERVCPKCQAKNDPEAMFCGDCGDHLEKSDRFTIERKIEASHCASCGHYNPIEAKLCEKCKSELGSGRSAVYRDEAGRLRLVRQPPAPLRVRLVSAAVLAVLFVGALSILQIRFGALKGDQAKLLRDPQSVAAAVVVVVGLPVILVPTTEIAYKARALFAVAFSAFQVLGALLEGRGEVLGGASLDQIRFGLHSCAMGWSLFFLVSSQFLGSFLTVGLCLVGLWCLHSSLVTLLSGADMVAWIARYPAWAWLPGWMTPAFVTFNIFLPYVLLQMTAHFFHQVAEARQYRSSNPADRAVLGEYRRRSLRGVFLNLFVVGLSMLVGLWEMARLGKANILTPVLPAIARLFGG